MNPVYRKLAKRLDTFPQGFPSTPSGVELRILEKIFSPEDADTALRLKLLPESVPAIARRLKRPVDETRQTLERMAGLGQIMSMNVRGRRRFMLAPFVVGIYEFQLPRMDRELAELFEQYAPTLLASLGGHEPPLARVVPVHRHIDAKAEILRYENLQEMMQGARSFRVSDCVCRLEKAALGEPCRHTVETCLSFSRSRSAYDNHQPWGRAIEKAEAFDILARCEDEGLVHCTYNLQHDNLFVCNCCECCCGFLRGIREFGAPNLLVSSNFVARIDEESCAQCGVCADQRCPMEAIDELDDVYSVNSERCIGCGVCAVDCPTDAITLESRPEESRTAPPANLVAWSFQRALNSAGPVRTLTRFGGLTLSAMRARRDTRE